MFSCLQVNFNKVCDENNLPKRVLELSYKKNGIPIYVVQRPTNLDFVEYKHWYALRNDDVRINELEYIENAITEQKIRNGNRNKKTHSK